MILAGSPALRNRSPVPEGFGDEEEEKYTTKAN
jgi:hypothetical protein